MPNGEVGERLHLPTVHARQDLGGRVLTAASQRKQAADVIEAGPAEKLDGTGHAALADALGTSPARDLFDDVTASDSERRSLLEGLDETLEVVGRDGDVGIEVAHEIVVDAVESIEPGTERVDLGREVGGGSTGPLDELHRWVPTGMAPDNVGRPVTRPVVNETHRAGRIVCASTDSIVRAIAASSSRAGVTKA